MLISIIFGNSSAEGRLACCLWPIHNQIVFFVFDYVRYGIRIEVAGFESEQFLSLHVVHLRSEGFIEGIVLISC